MASKESQIAAQIRLNQWAQEIQDCQNRPQNMTVDEWCEQHNIKKASYYWRLKRVRQALLEQMEIPDYKADVCVAFAQGNLGRAIMLCNSEHFNEIREEAIHFLKYI